MLGHICNLTCRALNQRYKQEIAGWFLHFSADFRSFFACCQENPECGERSSSLIFAAFRFFFFSFLLFLHLPSSAYHQASYWQKVLMQSGKIFKSVTSTPDRGVVENYRTTPPISIAMLVHKSALFLVGGRMYTTHLYHDMAAVCVSILLQKLGRG